MIKTLIVDDEKIVRKGLIAIMPWERYNMRVVGEAADGRKALEFLKENEVDLLITDLVMPVLSGFELMKEVQEHYPHIWMVVLTCHQDFNYIQETMRYGAIDYIVKTQLEKETLDEVLGRIAARLERKQADRMIISVLKEDTTLRTEIAASTSIKFSCEIVESMAKAIKFIKDNLGEDINQDSVAKEVNMSRGYFSHCFKEIIGMSFREYLRKTKVDKAKELLMETNKPIYMVACELGFRDEKYFSKLFREQTGLLPTDFRKMK